MQVVVSYFVVILGWIMAYFRGSFYNPLPWAGREDSYFMEQVVRNPEPVTTGDWVTYPSLGMVGETTGWTVFTWFVVWLCSFKGVAVTGRALVQTRPEAKAEAFSSGPQDEWSTLRWVCLS